EASASAGSPPSGLMACLACNRDTLLGADEGQTDDLRSRVTNFHVRPWSDNVTMQIREGDPTSERGRPCATCHPPHLPAALHNRATGGRHHICVDCEANQPPGQASVSPVQ